MGLQLCIAHVSFESDGGMCFDDMMVYESIHFLNEYVPWIWTMTVNHEYEHEHEHECELYLKLLNELCLVWVGAWDFILHCANRLIKGLCYGFKLLSRYVSPYKYDMNFSMMLLIVWWEQESLLVYECELWIR